MKFMQGDEFQLSVRDLFQKGGKFQKAAQNVQAIWGRANMDGANLESTFIGVSSTKNGESRIDHCVKYDLTGFARLVTVVNNGLCILNRSGF